MLISLFILNYIIKPVYSSMNFSQKILKYEPIYKTQDINNENNEVTNNNYIQDENSLISNNGSIILDSKIEEINQEIVQESQTINISEQEVVQIQQDVVEIEQEVNLDSDDFNWCLVIPKIELKAQIEEGTTQEILDKYIGHFETTSMLEGCIGLCAHNRGYNVNYFEKLNLLEEGDEVQYKHYNVTKNYIVKNKLIIDSNDWSLLESENENKLILITCVENEPQKRLAVICLEK